MNAASDDGTTATEAGDEPPQGNAYHATGPPTGSSQKPQHGIEAPPNWVGDRGQCFRRTLVGYKPLLQFQSRLQFQTHPRGIEKFQTKPAERLETATWFREAGRPSGQSQRIAGDRLRGCYDIRVSRRSREPFESGLTRLPSDGTRQCSGTSTLSDVPSRTTIRGGIRVRSESRAHDETRPDGRRGLSPASDGVKQQVENPLATTGRRLITAPANDDRTDRRPTPVRTSSSPPSPRWRSTTSPELSTGWRGVAAALEVPA